MVRKTKRRVSYVIGAPLGVNKIVLVKDLGMQLITPNASRPYRMGVFKCNGCGNEFTTQTSFITTGRTKGCRPCAELQRRNKYIAGQVIGNNGLIYKSEAYPDGSIRRGVFVCIGCNKDFTTRICDVASGRTSKCKPCSIDQQNIHGVSGTKLYSIWGDMQGRCNIRTNVSYKNYGARGITVCKEWLNDPKCFYDWGIARLQEEGYTEQDLGWGGSKLSIDRIDVDGNYSPSNCRFATASLQSRNTRVVSAVNVSGYRGMIHTNGKFTATIKVSGPPIKISIHDTRWAAAQSYDKYVIDNKLEHSTNNRNLPTILYCSGLDVLDDISYTSEVEYLLTGLCTRIINMADTESIIVKLAVLNVKVSVRVLELALLKLVAGYEYTYAVVEQCLRGSTIINLHS